MKITYNDKYDIFCNGNYITSVDSKEQLEKFFNGTYETQNKWKDMTGVDPIYHMNSQRFSVVRSMWPVFSEE